VKWQASTKGLSQIWLHIKEESSQNLKPCYNIVTFLKTYSLNMAKTIPQNMVISSLLFQ
jgi:hypothetical protein